jgi:hypothetical protein
MSIDVNHFPSDSASLLGRWHLVFSPSYADGTYAYSTLVEGARTKTPVHPRVARHFVAALGHDIRCAYSFDADPEGTPIFLGELDAREMIEILSAEMERLDAELPPDHPVRTIEVEPSDEELRALVGPRIFGLYAFMRKLTADIESKAKAAEAEAAAIEAAAEAHADELIAMDATVKTEAEEAARADRLFDELEERVMGASILDLPETEPAPPEVSGDPEFVEPTAEAVADHVGEESKDPETKKSKRSRR